jgi:protein phosphatase
LNRAVGIELFVRPDIIELGLLAGDKIVLCSDGLWGSIEDEEIGKITRSCADPFEASRQLVDLALAQGSDDNVSVIVLNIRQTDGPWQRRAGSAGGLLTVMRDIFRASSDAGAH